MADKERERRHLFALADALGDPRLLVAQPAEQPDFLLSSSPRVGIEVTEFDAWRGTSDGATVRDQSSLRERTIELAERTYYDLAPHAPLHVDVEFRDWPPLTKARVRPLASQLAAFLASDHRAWPQYDNPEMFGRYAIPSIPEISEVNPTRVSTRDHGVWSSGGGGWVYHATATAIERTVRSKEVKLPRYRRSCERAWLVVVFDLYAAGDHVAGPVEPITFSIVSAFDRILCFDRIAHRAVEIPATMPRHVLNALRD